MELGVEVDRLLVVYSEQDGLLLFPKMIHKRKSRMRYKELKKSNNIGDPQSPFLLSFYLHS